MSITRRQFLQTAGAISAATYAGSLLPSATRADSEADKKPNVLMILVDDLRPQLNCYGKSFMVTPNVDRLATGATVFDRHYCPQSLCAPARISLLSGVRPDTHGIYGLGATLYSRHPEIETIPQFFKNQGYTTASLGKFYHHLEDDPKGWSSKPLDFEGQSIGRGYMLKENIDILESGKSKIGVAFEKADVPDNAYAGGAIADAAVRLLGDMKSRPFFLGAGFHKPHLPFCAPAKYWDLYQPRDLQFPKSREKPNGAPTVAMGDNSAELRQYFGIPKTGPMPDDLARQLLHGYYAGVSYTDAQIGRVLAELNRLGLSENTIVVFTADHGWMLEEHGLWTKHSNFEEACRVPLMIRTPGQKSGQRVNSFTEHTDIYGTLCELIGQTSPPHIEGMSLAPLLTNPNRPGKSVAFSQYPRKGMGYTMRTDRYRFTRWGNSADAPVELYDYQTDPDGAINIADAPENKAQVKSLTEQLAAGWKAAHLRV